VLAEQAHPADGHERRSTLSDIEALRMSEMAWKLGWARVV